MGKIDAFEKRIIKQGMKDEDFEEYARLLRRVRGNFLKRQHCYVTAIQFSPKFAAQAVKLIHYGLQSFEDGWFSTYTAYLHIGRIYEAAGNYQGAYDSYLSAKDTLGKEHAAYIDELSPYLLWARLHIDAFCYSEELEAHYANCEKIGAFSKAFVNNEFKIKVASIVILRHHGKNDEAKRLFQSVMKMCDFGFRGKLCKILARHHYKEALTITPDAKRFLETVTL